MKLTDEQIQNIVTEFISLGDKSFFEDMPEVIEEDYEEAYDVLVNLDLDNIEIYVIDILRENYNLELNEMQTLDIISKHAGIKLTYVDFE